MAKGLALPLKAAIAAAAATLLSSANFPSLLFRLVFLHLAPLKEHYFPSDDVTISPQSRGVSWVLNSAPPPPQDVSQIRRLTDKFWPRVWEGTVGSEEVGVEVVPIPVGSAEGDAEYIGVDPPEPRRALLFLPKPSPTDDGGGTGDEGDDEDGPALVFVHGGGLISGTPSTEFGVSAEMARRCRCPVLGVDYRVLPEASAAEAVADVVAAFDWTAGRFPGRRVGVVGGSAGGVLSLLAGVALRDRARRARKGRPPRSGDGAGDGTRPPPPKPPPRQPASLALLSPGPGLEFLSEPPEAKWPSLSANAEKDGFMKGGFYEYVRKLVFDDQRNRRYLGSALKDLSDLPPCLVTAGGYEVLLDGVRSLRDALGSAGVDVDYREYERLQHVHHTLFLVSRESSEGLDDVVSFLREK